MVVPVPQRTPKSAAFGGTSLWGEPPVSPQSLLGSYMPGNLNIADHKARAGSPSRWAGAGSSTSERKLSVELPWPKQIYTVGSFVSGLVHLGTKDRDAIQDVQVSLVCVVHSMYDVYYGGSTNDYRVETSKLLHQDQVLWARTDGDASEPPAELHFRFAIPEFGNDMKGKNPNTPLPPSFHAGKYMGWGKSQAFGIPIGFVRYHIKASVVRKGIFKHKERAYSPFMFLPPSPPPPLLPTLPEVLSVRDLDHLGHLWHCDSASTTVRNGIFGSRGEAVLTLWMPDVPRFPRTLRIPFILCLVFRTHTVKGVYGAPPSHVLPPPAQLDKAALHLRRSIRSCAKGGVQEHKQVIEKDNFLHEITPQTDAWALKQTEGKSYWEQGHIWRGLFTIKEVPNFANRQLTCKYALVCEVPIKGVGNGAKLVSWDVEVSSGVAEGTSVAPTSEGVMLDLPPDYFEDIKDGYDEDDEDGYDMKKKT
ncbi:hypothetical protein JB92DRAFT_2969032 [Gautieria morchelliformis]|nr:hypothetical protein JB92DRAFT_2969032 [Gautieria morchelliformis]